MEHDSNSQTYWIIFKKSNLEPIAIWKPSEYDYKYSKVRISTNINLETYFEWVTDRATNLNLYLKQISGSVIILNDHEDCFIPIIKSNIYTPGFNVKVHNNDFNLEIPLKGNLDVYQSFVGVWEPFIEEFGICLKAIQRKNKFEVQLNPLESDHFKGVYVNFSPESY